MSNDRFHPIDPLLVRIEGVHRVHIMELLHSSCEYPLKVSVMLTCRTDRPTIAWADFNLAFTTDGVGLYPLPGMPQQQKLNARQVVGVLGARPGYYRLGLGECGCPASGGGDRWSPLCVALTWAPSLRAHRTALAKRWQHLIEAQSHHFCPADLKEARKYGFLLRH